MVMGLFGWPRLARALSQYPVGTYAAGWGTSFSAPFVSGAGALLLNLNPATNESKAAAAVAHAVPLGAGMGSGRLDPVQASPAAGYTERVSSRGRKSLPVLNFRASLLDASLDQFGFHFGLLSGKKSHFGFKCPISWQRHFDTVLSRTYR